VPDVFIPRPETEILVEHMVERIRGGGSVYRKAPVRILDIGTGCGNIALSLASLVPHAQVVAIDVSDKALSTARKNAESLGLNERVEFVQRDMRKKLEKLNQCWQTCVKGYLLLVTTRGQ